MDDKKKIEILLQGLVESVRKNERKENPEFIPWDVVIGDISERILEMLASSQEKNE